MRTTIFSTAAVLLALGSGCARGTGSAASATTASPTVAIVNVSVVPMDRDTVLRDAAILVRDGRISWMGRRSALRVPAGAQVVDGNGGYVIPGLADMHTHLFSDAADVPDSLGALELGVMLANGVTTARLMIGTPAQLALRRAVADGRVAGPQLWVASPQLAGRPSENTLVVTNETEARSAVRTAVAAGYDFIKLTLFLSPASFEAIIDEAAKANIRVVGHVEPDVGVERALRTGMQMEHLDSYLEAVLRDDAPSRVSLTQGRVFQMRNWPSLDHVDDAKIDRIAGASARAGVFLGPTQHVFNTSFATGEDTATIRGRADFAYWPATLARGYFGAHTRYWAPANDTIKTPARRRRYVDVRNRLIKAYTDSGGRLLAGSDTPEWFNTYGFGIHRELQAFVAAGLTPYQALKTSTVHPALYLGGRAQGGTIAVGRAADLVLLRADPRADIRNTETIAGVMAAGRWHSRAELDAMLARARGAMQALP